jgi:Cu(I)/Ag(I) efflux system membrane protein CusA/SilA
VTYPIVTALLGTPHVKAVRAFSDFGYSYVYVIFQDGTDLYWARSRVLEYLSKIQSRLPEGVQTEMGPDATSIGLGLPVRARRPQRTERPRRAPEPAGLAIRYRLQAVPGVARSRRSAGS